MNQKQQGNCGKVPYPTRQEAEATADHRMETPTTPLLRVYECEVCGNFHLTSNPPRLGGRL